MKQLLQSLKSGALELVDAPCPQASRGGVLIRTRRSLISAGTERMLLDFGKAGWLEKARQQPDKVRQVLDKIRTDGLVPTLEAVRDKLDQPIPMGYCNCGEVVEVGSGITDLQVGDRVISNGHHAEMVSLPRMLCAKIPDGVGDEEAAFAVLGSIALQGLRLLAPTLGESFVVSGLGLVGLLTSQLLRAQGCRVLGLDFDSNKLGLARQWGVETCQLGDGVDPVAWAMEFSRGRGVDGVIIAAATKSNDPIHQAAQMCRQRGRLVLVGVVGLELNRDDFYKKELTFQVSCSYGPGRYDSSYEQKGNDYPLGFVRWTEQRNFEAILDMMAENRLQVKPLISHRFPFSHAQEAYETLSNGRGVLGIMLEYSDETVQPTAVLRGCSVALPTRITEMKSTSDLPAVGPVIGMIGAGNYALRTLLPALCKAGARCKIIATNSGISATLGGRKFGFAEATTDVGRIFQDRDIELVVVATRHDTHAGFICDALKAGKSVFVEKPLAMTYEEIDQIASAHAQAQAIPGVSQQPRMVMVGFNRRFAPQVVKMKQLLSTAPGPKSLIATINAGQIPADNWTQDPQTGGGRIIGEACHFIDLLRFLVDQPIVKVRTYRMGRRIDADTASIGLEFADGSIGTVHYFTNGSRSFPKERVEVFTGGRVLQLDNFRKLIGFGWSDFKRLNLWRQNKGPDACAMATMQAIRNRLSAPIPFIELLEVARATVTAAATL